MVGRHTLDETLSETDAINQNIREILDVQTEEWGIKVTVVELRDIQLPESMQRAMARQAEAEREKRAKIIAAEGEALAAGELARASDVMMAHPLALQLRNLQTLAEVAVDKNSTVVFPAPLMSTIAELGAFLARETKAAQAPTGRGRSTTEGWWPREPGGQPEGSDHLRSPSRRPAGGGGACAPPAPALPGAGVRPTTRQPGPDARVRSGQRQRRGTSAGRAGRGTQALPLARRGIMALCSS